MGAQLHWRTMSWRDRLVHEHERAAQDPVLQERMAHTIRTSDVANLNVAACSLERYGHDDLALTLRAIAQQIREGELTTGRLRT